MNTLRRVLRVMVVGLCIVPVTIAAEAEQITIPVWFHIIHAGQAATYPTP